MWHLGTGVSGGLGSSTGGTVGLDSLRGPFQLKQFMILSPVGPDGLYWEVAAVIVGPLLIIFERSWRLAEVPGGWKRENITCILKDRKKEDLGNYRPVNLTSVPGKLMERIILESISKHMKDKIEFWSSQHGFMQGKSCLSQPDSLLQWGH